MWDVTGKYEEALWGGPPATRENGVQINLVSDQLLTTRAALQGHPSTDTKSSDRKGAR